MVSICIVDDDKEFLERTKNHVEKFEAFSNYSISSFSDSENPRIFNIEYSIYIFDIDMPNINGFELAKEIRKKNDSAIILFVSSHQNFVYDSFDFQAFHFIRKDMFESDMDKALSRLGDTLKNRKQTYVYKKNGKIISIEYQDIVYFEKDKNDMCIYTKKHGELNERKSMGSILKDVQSDDFCLINSGLLINFYNVKEIQLLMVVMTNGTTLEISRRKAKEVKGKYANYLFGADN